MKFIVWVTFTLLFATTVLCVCCFAQGIADQDQREIEHLIIRLCSHEVAPEEVLDPESKTRSEWLSRLSDPNYRLSLIKSGNLTLLSSDRAEMPVRVHFADVERALESTATAKFVKRNGTWYFETFDFLETPTVLITVIVGSVLIGILYAGCVLLLFFRLQRRGQLDVPNRVRLFLPFLWPKLFRQTR